MLGITFHKSNPLESQVIGLHICPKCHTKMVRLTDNCRQCQKCKVIYVKGTTVSAGGSQE